VSDFSAFGNLERSGWLDAKRAFGYVEWFASASDQAINRLLDAADATQNSKALDLCCGQGNVSEALLRHGCKVFGVDFSPAMLALTGGNLH
jgi:2-polyprenyl-3-methyl-5-hydroxy-6-metoxy-1,4-benzoquinol methylase